ncbi:hypothetical protein [Rhodococcus rhodnii]|nr:hypothetical protein [Rhodococcus rhodnii]
MKYLRLSADYSHLGLTAVGAGPVDVRSLDAPRGLVDDLEKWNADYQPIIQMSRNERASEGAQERIRSLDIRGMDLADRLASESAESCKVEYYSEGLLRPVSRDYFER